MPFVRDGEPARKKRLTPAEALAKITRYCAYQERSHHETRQKLFDFGLYPSEVEELLAQLIQLGFLNEERFAKAFAGGKFRMKQWGRVKIQHELQAQGLTKNCIQRGLSEIDAADYRKTLQQLLRKKLATINEPNAFKKRDKVARFAIGKGYEPELVWEYLKDLLPS
jgi:regulatory protein